MREKDVRISIAKGIGMILVVSGHCQGAFNFDPFFPYSFHMPLFFFISGFLIQEKYLAHPFSFVVRYIKSILVPWISYFIILGAASIFLLYFLTGTKNPFTFWYPSSILRALATGDSGWLFFPGWFLVSLFWAMVFFCLIASVCRKFNVHEILMFFLLFPMAVLCIKFGQTARDGMDYVIVNRFLSRNFVAAFFVFAGYICKKYVGVWRRNPLVEETPKDTSRSDRLPWWDGPSLSLMVLFVAQFYVTRNFPDSGYFNFGANLYHSLWLPFVTTFLGISFVFTTSSMLASIPKNDWLIRIGDNSLHIMALHITVFELISVALSIGRGGGR
jgi:fucose 4-O-acetylase-like acetyltransferase